MKSFSKFTKHLFVASSLMIGLANAPHASAQFAIYNTLAFANRQTNISNQNGYFAAAGFGAGAYYDGHRYKGVSMGVDIRGADTSNDRFGLIGFRAALHPKRRDNIHPPVSPYAELLLGGGTFSDTAGNQDAHMFIQGVVGMDIPLGPVNFRVLEVGIGRTPFGNSTGSAYSGGDLWLVTESSGVVYRF